MGMFLFPTFFVIFKQGMRLPVVAIYHSYDEKNLRVEPDDSLIDLTFGNLNLVSSPLKDVEPTKNAKPKQLHF